MADKFATLYTYHVHLLSGLNRAIASQEGDPANSAASANASILHHLAVRKFGYVLSSEGLSQTSDELVASLKTRDENLLLHTQNRDWFSVMSESAEMISALPGEPGSVPIVFPDEDALKAANVRTFIELAGKPGSRPMKFPEEEV